MCCENLEEEKTFVDRLSFCRKGKNTGKLPKNIPVQI
jgi:hypothetical protein